VSHDQVSIVTGGAGFIGSHLVKKLLEMNHKVCVLDNFSTGKRENLMEVSDHKNILIIETDLRRRNDHIFTNIEEKFGSVDNIIHLAAQTAVINSIEDPIGDVESNYMSLVNIMEYFKYRHLKKVVFASSAAVYGDTTECPIKETQDCKPLSPYGVNKLCCESYLYFLNKVYSIPTVSLRFFNVYGPFQDPNSPYSGVISIFIKRILEKQNLSIFGDGEQTRDFVYINDIISGILKALGSNIAKSVVANLGTGKEVSVNLLAKTLIDISGSTTSEIIHQDSRSGEILQSVSCVQTALDSFNYRYEVNLQDGLRDTFTWYEKTQR